MRSGGEQTSAEPELAFEDEDEEEKEEKEKEKEEGS